MTCGSVFANLKATFQFMVSMSSCEYAGPNSIPVKDVIGKPTQAFTLLFWTAK